MKIFNWVHRKFHNKDESSENVKMSKAEHGTGALLKQFAIGDVNIDDWSEGILSIGTFGYDPSPNGFDHQQVQFDSFEIEQELEKIEKEDAKEDGAEVEINTSDDQGGEDDYLVLNASSNDFSNKDVVCDRDQNAVDDLAVDDLENVQCATTELYENKERITLADLFLADSDEYMHNTTVDKDQREVLNEPKSMKKAGSEVFSKLKLPFAKKFSPKVKQEYSNSSLHPRGIKKIQKMMTRMLKKKIHPEVESKKQIKKDNQMKYAGNYEVIEMASLLQTRGSCRSVDATASK